MPGSKVSRMHDESKNTSPKGQTSVDGGTANGVQSTLQTKVIVVRYWFGLFLLVGCTAPAETKPIPVASVSAVVRDVTPVPSVSSAPEPEEPVQKLLVAYTTKFKADEKAANRAANIELVAGRFEGDVKLEPGEEFSFNKLVGPRSEAAGFKNAPTIFMGEVFEGIGGGTCQVSSTLYAAALHAGLTIVERRPHSRPSTYIDPGLDATVSYPVECETKNDPTACYDLRFKNPYDFPLYLRVNVSLSYDADDKRSVTASIFGNGEIPKVTTRWASWNTPPFEKRTRRVSYWKNDRRRLKQAGHVGLEGARYLTLTYPDGHVEKREVVSRYQPQPEVWEVGMEWKDTESQPQ